MKSDKTNLSQLVQLFSLVKRILLACECVAMTTLQISLLSNFKIFGHY